MFSHSSTCVGFLYGFFAFRFFLGSFSLLFPSALFSSLLWLSSSSFFAFLVPFRYPPSPHALPSLFASQLSIRVRLTQLTSLVLLEPLDFRPLGFSPSFSLLMSTFLLLIAWLWILTDSTSPCALQNTLLPELSPFSRLLTHSRFGPHLSLFYLWCLLSPIVRCYAFIIRLAASMPTAYLSSTSYSLPHFNRV